MLKKLLLGFIVIIVELLALLKVLLDPIETINIHRLQDSNNISCFLLYCGMQIPKLNNIAFPHSHNTYDKSLYLETVIEYYSQASGSGGPGAHGGLDGDEEASWLSASASSAS